MYVKLTGRRAAVGKFAKYVSQFWSLFFEANSVYNWWLSSIHFWQLSSVDIFSNETHLKRVLVKRYCNWLMVDKQVKFFKDVFWKNFFSKFIEMLIQNWKYFLKNYHAHIIVFCFFENKMLMKHSWSKRKSK